MKPCPHLTIYATAKSTPKSNCPWGEILLDVVTVILSALGFLSALAFLLTMG